MSYRSEGWISSIPLEVYWEGWRSNTYELQQSGWELAAQQDPYTFGLQIALRNRKIGLVGLSQFISERIYFEVSRFGGPSPSQLPPIYITSMSNRPEIHRVEYINSTIDSPHVPWAAIDARPEYHNYSIDTIEDLIPFRKIEVPEEKELIIDPNSVPELMSRILNLQAPKQKEIREKARRERKRQNIEAQIITIAA